MIEPIEFINKLRESDRYIEVIYTEGSCYQFFKVLKALYPNAKPIKVKWKNTIYNHIITEIDNRYYDITGEVKLSDYDYKYVVKEDLFEIEKWSFSKKAWLSKECPICEEPIIYELK